jgi:hypothetical protein
MFLIPSLVRVCVLALVLLAAVSLLPYLYAFGHTRLPWPLRLIGRDADALAEASALRASRAALLHDVEVWAPYEAAVAALAADLAARPEFAAFAGGGGGAPALHVCTVASRWAPGLDLLRESAAAVGLAVTVLGEGDTELSGWGEGLGRKLFHVGAFARALPPTDFVLLVDAYDVVFMARPHAGAFLTALARALLLEPEDPAGGGGGGGSPPGEPGGALARARAALAASPPRRLPTVLLSAEAQCMEDLRVGAHAPAAAALRFPCLNSGGVLGPAGDVATLLGAVDFREELANDQRAVYRGAALARRDVTLPLPAVDHFADVFLALLGVDTTREVLWDPERRAWLLRGGAPSAAAAVWHWPGFFKRMSFAAGLLSGRRGAGADGEVAAAVSIAWAIAAAAFALGAAAVVAAERGACGGGGCGYARGGDAGDAGGADELPPPPPPPPLRAATVAGCARRAAAACGSSVAAAAAALRGKGRARKRAAAAQE